MFWDPLQREQNSPGDMTVARLIMLCCWPSQYHKTREIDQQIDGKNKKREGQSHISLLHIEARVDYLLYIQLIVLDQSSFICG